MIKPSEWSKYESKLPGVIPKDRFVKLEISRPSEDKIKQIKEIEDPTPAISDILDELGIEGVVPASVLKPISSGKVVVGPVITIRYIKEKYVTKQLAIDSSKGKLGDRDAYAISQPGDVVVFDNGGRENISTMGGLSTRSAINAKLSGCIVDGGVRDISEIRRLGFPVWSRGRSPISGKRRVETIEINGPVMCGGVRVMPGDLAVADDSGICFIPQEHIDKVIRLLVETVKAEEELTKALNKGLSMKELKSIISPDKW